MARYHEIESSLWDDIQENTPDEKLLYIFSFSNPSTRDSGMYRISVPSILLNTGLTRERFEGALKGLGDKLQYDFDNKVMFVSGKFKRRLSGLKTNVNVIKAMKHDLDEFSCSFVSRLFKEKYKEALEGLGSLSLTLPLTLPLRIGGMGERKNDVSSRQIPKGIPLMPPDKDRWQSPPKPLSEMIKEVQNEKIEPKTKLKKSQIGFNQKNGQANTKANS